MKIKTKKLSYDKVLCEKKAKHKKPFKPSPILKTLIKIIGAKDLKKANFSYEILNKLDKAPYLILMNHSSFIDLEIVSKIFSKIPYNIVCTSDGFVGKELLMRHIGCIPTQKYVHDITLIKDMKYAISKNTSVLMYPEASYSFDGTATPLPEGLSRLIKLLNVPVIFVKTYGAFSYDPLYNCLQKRKVKVSAEVKQILSKEDIKNKTNAEIDEILTQCFNFDNFKWQQDNKVLINESFRADGLERILYKCPSCKREGKTKGKGIYLKCENCNKTYTLDEFGFMKAVDGETEFTHIPDWYNWQRKEVKEQLLNNTYNLNTEVDIGVIVDYKAVYMVGKGILTHDENGFTLKGVDNDINYSQSPLASYSLYSDYFWYELGDVICIGDKNCLYYCFVKKGVSVAKARLATEELYKLRKQQLTEK